MTHGSSPVRRPCEQAISWSSRIQHVSDSSVHCSPIIVMANWRSTRHVSGDVGSLATLVHLKLQFTYIPKPDTFDAQGHRSLIKSRQDSSQNVESYQNSSDRMSDVSGLSILTNISFHRIHNLIFTEGKVHSTDQDSPDTKSLMA
jgi:hypothetical protein